MATRRPRPGSPRPPRPNGSRGLFAIASSLDRVANDVSWESGPTPKDSAGSRPLADPGSRSRRTLASIPGARRGVPLRGRAGPRRQGPRRPARARDRACRGRSCEDFRASPWRGPSRAADRPPTPDRMTDRVDPRRRRSGLPGRRPACATASSIRLRASRSAPSSTAPRQPLAGRPDRPQARSPRRGGLAWADRSDSSEWVIASTPVAAVGSGREPQGQTPGRGSPPSAARFRVTDIALPPRSTRP